MLQGNALEWQKKKKKGFEMYAYIASTWMLGESDTQKHSSKKILSY